MIPLIPRKPRSNQSHSLASDEQTMNNIASNTVQAIGCLSGSLNENEDVTNSQWRSYGMNRRRKLLEEDEASGGKVFDLNYECRIQGYFKLSEKIISQFNAAFRSGDDLEATYVMGHRLIHFLSEALPKHPDYMKKDASVSKLREKSFQSLLQIKKHIEALALRIDEEQLNKYIMHDFDPFAEDDCSTSSCSEAEGEQLSLSPSTFAQDDSQWESFDGWSFDLPEKMTSHRRYPEFVKDGHLLKEHDKSAETEDTSNETFSSSEHSFEEFSEDHMPIYNSFGLDFLKRIASEDVRYETDSEAVDSWAQESEIESAVYSMSSMGDTYDPARIALKEILANKRTRPSQQQSSGKQLGFQPDFEGEFDDSKENQSLDFDLSPDTSYDSLEEEEVWNTLTSNNGGLRARILMDRVTL